MEGLEALGFDKQNGLNKNFLNEQLNVCIVRKEVSVPYSVFPYYLTHSFYMTYNVALTLPGCVP